MWNNRSEAGVEFTEQNVGENRKELNQQQNRRQWRQSLAVFRKLFIGLHEQRRFHQYHKHVALNRTGNSNNNGATKKDKHRPKRRVRNPRLEHHFTNLSGL